VSDSGFGFNPTGRSAACATGRHPDDVWAGFTEHWEQTRREQQERREAKKQAEHAVRDAAYGKTREELRDLYIAEFRARGLDLPPEVYLEAEIDQMTGHPLRGLLRLWRHTFSDT
jgi:hypothetical protein